MNKLMQAIESCMSSFESREDRDLSAVFCFPSEFVGFQGHFPGNPVLPAVCILQAITVMAARQTARSVELKKVLSAKWFSPTGPDTHLNFLVHIAPGGPGEATISARISRDNGKVADVLLLVGWPAREGGPLP